MGLEDVKIFHVLSNGTVKGITAERYNQCLKRKGYLVGYVDATYLYLAKSGTGILLRRDEIEQIFNLFDNAKEA